MSSSIKCHSNTSRDYKDHVVQFHLPSPNSLKRSSSKITRAKTEKQILALDKIQAFINRKWYIGSSEDLVVTVNSPTLPAIDTTRFNKDILQLAEFDQEWKGKVKKNEKYFYSLPKNLLNKFKKKSDQVLEELTELPLELKRLLDKTNPYTPEKIREILFVEGLKSIQWKKISTEAVKPLLKIDAISNNFLEPLNHQLTVFQSQDADFPKDFGVLKTKVVSTDDRTKRTKEYIELRRDVYEALLIKLNLTDKFSVSSNKNNNVCELRAFPSVSPGDNSSENDLHSPYFKQPMEDPMMLDEPIQASFDSDVLSLFPYSFSPLVEDKSFDFLDINN